jgi:hypothetical protein
MTFRAEVLRQIGRVPETLRIQADEYLFTMGAVFSEALILREALTFYRLHESNAFQIANGNTEALKRKQKVLEVLGKSLEEQMREAGASAQASRVVVESVETEAGMIRLRLENRWPWETVGTELRNYRIMQGNAPASHVFFKMASLLPACVMPSRIYYLVRNRFAENGVYRKAREKWLPFPEPSHVDRYGTTRR